MADNPDTKSRHIALQAVPFAVMALLVAVILAGLSEVVPGISPPAAEGAPLAKPSDLLFYVIAGVTVVSAAGVAFSKDIIHSALSLLGALLGAGAIYIYLQADFVAVTQLLIYVGGVLVLILFAVMLTSRIGNRRTNPSTGVVPGLALLSALVGVFGFIATRTPWRVGPEPLSIGSTVERIGDLFLGEYLLAFEVISLLLVATLIGAVVVARKEIKE